MELKDFNWPEIREVDIAFSTLEAPKELLEEAKKRGFYNNHDGEYNKLFSKILFNGAKVKPKKGYDQDLAEKAWPWAMSFIRSWKPKHQEKEAICAMIFSELLEP